MGDRITRTLTFDVHECMECSILFGLPSNFMPRRREDHRTFYCPNGHQSYFPNKSDLDRAKEQLEAANARASRMEKEMHDARIAAQNAIEARHKLETEANRQRTRAGNGVCPCCNRSFAALARHMQTKHPEFKK